jgi:hypothetical protein
MAECAVEQRGAELKQWFWSGNKEQRCGENLFGVRIGSGAVLRMGGCVGTRPAGERDKYTPESRLRREGRTTALGVDKRRERQERAAGI